MKEMWKVLRGQDPSSAGVTASVMRLTSLLIGVVTLTLLIRIAQYGMSLPRLLQLVACAALLVATYAQRNRSDVRWLPVALIGLIVLSISAMLQFGLAAQVFLAMPVGLLLASVVLGTRAAAILLAVQCILLLGLAFGYTTGAIGTAVDLDEMNVAPMNWILLIFDYTLLAFYVITLTEMFRDHWHQKNTDLTLHKEALAAATSHAPEGVAVQDVDTGHFVELNPTAERLLGEEASALVDRKGLQEVSAEIQADGRASGQVLQALLEDALDGQAPRFEWVLRGKDGQDIACEVTMTTLTVSGRQLVRISFIDISERAAAGQIRDLMSLVFRTSSEGMILCDADGRVERVNPAFERDTWISSDEIVGRSLGELLAENDRAVILEALRDTRPVETTADQRWNGEIRFRRKDGSTFPGWAMITAIRDSSGRLIRFIVLVRNLSELRRANEEIQRQSEVDFLTGLPNRLSLIRHVSAGIGALSKQPETDGTGLVLLFLDVDQFMQVNDRYGQNSGDMVLKFLAMRLASCLGPEDLLARLAGDEFAVLFRGPDANQRAPLVASEMRNEIARPFHVDRGTVHITASLGMAVFPGDGEDTARLMLAADQVLFAAKAAGGNRVLVFTPEIGRRARDRSRLMDELQRALERGELELHYQPVVDLENGALSKVEALVRWRHPELGLLGPDRFIPLAEEARLIDRIGDWVLAQCGEDLPRMRDGFGAQLQASINVSPLELASGGKQRGAQWLARVAEAAAGGAPLILEITENALLDPDPAMVEQLNRLRAAGAQLALDDFGAGHTSLNYYLTHNFEFLKIDRVFVHNVPHDPRSVALCETILGFAGRLEAVSIAEGIETIDQVEMLRAAGCALGQGYFFSPPLALDSLLALPPRFPVHRDQHDGATGPAAH